MQKLDYIKRLNIIEKELRSEVIVDYIGAGSKQMGANMASLPSFVGVLLASKSNYDNLIKQTAFIDILTFMAAPTHYENVHYAQMISVLNGAKIFQNAAYHPSVYSFYTFHLTLIQAASFAKLLISPEIIQEIESPESGILILQVSSESEGLTPLEYSRIFSILAELVELFEKVYDEARSTRIVLLDSGSDTGIGLRSKVELATSLFQAFKEVWDFMVNRENYRSEKENDMLMNNLDVIERIRTLEKEKILSDEEARAYEALAVIKIKSMIRQGVLPKQIVEGTESVASRTLLLTVASPPQLLSANPTPEE